MKRPRLGWSWLGILVTLLAIGWSRAIADHFLPVLETRTGVYSNVTVTLKTPRSIHIRHDRGIGNIDVAELNDETKEALGYAVERKDQELGATGVGALSGEWLNTLQFGRGESVCEGPVPLQIPFAFTSGFWAIVLSVALLVHLFFSYCSRLICVKAGSEPGIMVWLPILQIFPLLRAAGMSGWWFLGLFVPLLNLVVQILWCIKIVNARGKHVVWAILLILPLVNLVAFLYLAFSNHGDSRESLDLPVYSPRPV